MAVVQLYGKLGANAFGGETGGEARQMDWASDSIVATLHTSSYAPNIDSHELYADLNNELTTANGYTADTGITVTTSAPSYNSTGNVTTMGASTISITASGGTLTFRYMVIRDRTITGGPLIGYIDCGAQSIESGNTFSVTVASGIFTATVS